MHMLLVRIITICVLSVVCSEDENMKNQWKMHNKFVTSFACKEPQLRIVDIKDLVNETTWADIHTLEIIPPVTVLPRCFQTGYCSKGCGCQPSAVKDVTVVFGVLKDNNVDFIEVHTVNHTSCACEQGGDKPK